MLSRLFVAALLTMAPVASMAQTSTSPPTGASYASLADLVLQSPAIVRATISRAKRLSADNSPGLRAGHARLLITAKVDAALVAPSAVPPQLSWLLDVPLDGRGRTSNPRGETVLAFIDAPDSRGRTRLIGAEAQLPWDTELEGRVRAIATEARSSKVPVVTGVSNGFRVAGTLPGESESQFFLSTKAGKPLTMVVLERPGMARSISVASGDIIDESAASVVPETLLWYRLACTLPKELPIDAGGNDPALANAWIAAMSSLGSCVR